MTEQNVAVFGSSATRPGTDRWDEAELVGRRFAVAGLGVVTGGYGGTMEAASKGAAEAGGRVIGVTAPQLFQDRFGANRFVGEEVSEPTLTSRIGRLNELASGTVVLPGSIGTAAELVVAWNTNHIARLAGFRRLPTVTVGPVLADICRVLADQLGANQADIQCVDTGDEAVDWMLSQPEIHGIRGVPL